MDAIATVILFFLVDVLGIRSIQKDGPIARKIVVSVVYFIFAFILLVIYLGVFVI